MLKQIPNALTLANLACGVLAILFATSGDLNTPVYLIGLAAIFDFFDGFAARLLKVSGPLGKELDSLADAVSFGVVPAIMLIKAVDVYVLGPFPPSTTGEYIMRYSPILIALFSAFRLAKFNIDTRQSERFIGLPTPANTLFIISLIWGIDSGQIFLQEILLNPYAILGLSVVSSYLLIAEIPLLALKFKHYKWKGNELRFSLLITSIPILFIFQFLGLSIIVLLYLVMSMIDNRIHRYEIQS